MGKRLLIYALIAVHDILAALLLCVFIPLSFFHKKTRLYTLSRMRTLKICKSISTGQNNRVVFYCSSVGEFEQAIPLINKFESNGQKVILFFHSKQGYNYCRKISEFEAYLTPFDLCCNWIIILSKIKPQQFIINRNEFWPGSLMAAFICSNLYVINFVAKPKTAPLETFAIYLSKKVFQVNDRNIEIKKMIVTGDTRQDRLLQRYETNKHIIEELRNYTKIRTGQKLVVIGNAYSGDLQILLKGKSLFHMYKFLVVPARGEFSTNQFPHIPVLNSPDLIDWNKNDIVILDVVGILFELYGCANIAWISGGFDKGIHNCMEADFFNIPLISGPDLNNQPDAVHLRAENKLHIFDGSESLETALNQTRPQITYAQPLEKHSPTEHIYSILHEDYYSGQKELKSCA